MKDQILSVEASDDLASAGDKIRRTQADRVLLLWPQPVPRLSSPLHLALLDRAAQKVGARLAVISRAPAILALAFRAAVSVFPTPEAALASQPSDWIHRARLGVVRSSGREGIVGGDLATRRLALLASRDAQHHRVSIAGHPRLRLVAFALPTVLVLLAALLLLPSASVSVKMPTGELERSLHLDRADALPLTVDLSASDRAPTTLEEVTPVAYAKGMLQVTNRTGQSLQLASGTEVRDPDSGTEFATVTPVVLMPNATALVAVRASLPGWGGNLRAGQLTQFAGALSLLVSASNPEPTAGGRAESRYAVAETDLSHLRQKVIAHVNELAATQLAARARQEGRILVQGSSAVQVTAEQADAQAGMIVDSVSMTIQARATALTFPENSLVQTATDFVQQTRAPEDLPVDGRPQIEAVQQANGDMVLNVHARSVLRVDTGGLSRAVAFHTPDSARKLIWREIPSAEEVQVGLNPVWLPLLPLYPFRTAVREVPAG